MPPLGLFTEANSLHEASLLFLIEDDSATREAVAGFLIGRGMKVQSFASCESFLEHTLSSADGYLLLDYHFAGMDGFQLLEALRARGTSLPTILYTGRFNGNLRRRAAAYPEVIAFLQKPLGGQSLLDALQAAFRRGDTTS